MSPLDRWTHLTLPSQIYHDEVSSSCTLLPPTPNKLMVLTFQLQP